jgi:uncharacterized membrane protein
MGLLFVAAGFLVMSSPVWGKRQRQILLVIAAVGVELCHYSSSYVFFITLVAAWAGQTILTTAWLPAWARAKLPQTSGVRWSSSARTLGIGCLVAIFAVIVLWGGLATRTADGVVGEFRSAVSEFVHHDSGDKSGSVGYGLVSGGSSTSTSQIDQYRGASLRLREKVAPGTLIPLSVVDQYPTPVVNQPNLPPTAAGRLLARMGIAPSSVNDVMRSLAAKGEQVFLLIGMVALLFAKRRRGTVAKEYYWLCVAAVAALVVITVLPNLSVDYGILRAFQQALILIAPVIVVGSLTLLQPLGAWWSRAVAVALGLAIFASTTGLVPQVLGGYPAQLNLNNSGQYYELYYMTPQEVAAVDWLGGQPDTLPGGVQSGFTSERFAFTSPSKVSGQQYLTDLFPTYLERNTWVVIDESMLQTGTATVSVNGNLITYRYPFALLEREKNLVFDNGQTKIYQ